MEEDVELLIFDRNTSTKSDVFKVLNKANLTGHGYKEEVSYQTVMSPESTSYFKASTMILAFGNSFLCQKSKSSSIPSFLGVSFLDRFCFPILKLCFFFFFKSFFYYKLENCSRIPKIEEELETLIPGKLTVIQCITIDIFSQ